MALWQQRRQLGDDAQPSTWQKEAAMWLSAILGFTPSSNHEFYVIALWFFAISLLHDSRWSLSDPTLAEKVPLFLIFSFFAFHLNVVLVY